MKAVTRVLERVLGVACVVLFAVLVVVVVWQVFSRQVLGSPSTWSEEAARYLFVWLGLFGAALVFSERGHIAVDFLIRRLPKPVLRGALVLIQLTIVTLAALVFVYGGWKYSQQAWAQQLSALPVNVGSMYLVMPITGALIIWFAVQHLIEALVATEPVSVLGVDEEAEVALATYGDGDVETQEILDDPSPDATDDTGDTDGKER